MPGRSYKKRHLKELSASERTAIVHRSLIGLEHRPDLAKEYRVSCDLIQKLVARVRERPSALRELHE